MQPSKRRVRTEDQHRPAVSTSSIYSSSLGLHTDIGDRQPQASPAGRAPNPLPPVRAIALRIGSLARPPSVQTPLAAPGP